MPALQVKDFPGDLYEELRECASMQDRNISQQTVHVLREYLRAYKQGNGNAAWAAHPAVEQSEKPMHLVRTGQTPEDRIARRKKVFEAIDSIPKFTVPDYFPDSADLVRRMREERDDQIVPELRQIR